MGAYAEVHVWYGGQQIEKLQKMSASDLDAEISTKEKEITTAESNFKVPPLLCLSLHCCPRFPVA